MKRTPFKVAIIDPPWPYAQASKHERLTGYSTGHHYKAITMSGLAAMPVAALANYVFLWTTGPFIEQSYTLLRHWGFEPITFLAWVKTQSVERAGEAPFKGDEFKFKPTYGVGYWFRGCVEPIIVAKKPGMQSVRTQWVGLLSPNAKHSRKPDTLHELIEKSFRGPYLEMFGRRRRRGWTVIGNEIDNCGIEKSIGKILRSC